MRIFTEACAYVQEQKNNTQCKREIFTTFIKGCYALNITGCVFNGFFFKFSVDNECHYENCENTKDNNVEFLYIFNHGRADMVVKAEKSDG